MSASAQAVIEKIRELPEDQLAEVIDFVDVLREHREDRRLVQEAMQLSRSALTKVWDNPEDAVYDDLKF